MQCSKKLGKLVNSPHSPFSLGQGTSFGSQQCQSGEWNEAGKMKLFPTFFAWLYSCFCSTLLLKLLQLPQSFTCLWTDVSLLFFGGGWRLDSSTTPCWWCPVDSYLDSWALPGMLLFVDSSLFFVDGENEGWRLWLPSCWFHSAGWIVTTSCDLYSPLLLSSTSKDPYNYMGPIWMIQGNLIILCSID